MAAHPPIIFENPTQLVERTKFPPPPLHKTQQTINSQQRLNDMIFQSAIIDWQQMVKLRRKRFWGRSLEQSTSVGAWGALFGHKSQENEMVWDYMCSGWLIINWKVFFMRFHDKITSGRVKFTLVVLYQWSVYFLTHVDFVSSWTKTSKYLAVQAFSVKIAGVGIPRHE